MWRHLTNDITITSENDNSSCSFTASQTEQNTYNCKTATHNIVILCTSTEHVFSVSAILSQYKLHTMPPFTDALVNTDC